MADIHERLTERDRGAKAKQIIENPLWVEAWDKIESGLTHRWQTSQKSDADLRENIYLQLDAARAVQKYFEQLVQTGELAEMQIEQERSDGRRGTD